VHPAPIQLNRMYLLTIMLEAGFVHHPNEWWHYQLPDAKSFPLIDSHDFMHCAADRQRPGELKAA
jgi:D-alanyl-D-alanine dipeptidase